MRILDHNNAKLMARENYAGANIIDAGRVLAHPKHSLSAFVYDRLRQWRDHAIHLGCA